MSERTKRSPSARIKARSRKSLPPGLLKAWHIVALLLLLNIIVTALLSVELPFQQFGFEQPNLGVLMAPFNLLPAVVVPLVIAGHIVGLRVRRKT